MTATRHRAGHCRPFGHGQVLIKLSTPRLPSICCHFRADAGAERQASTHPPNDKGTFLMHRFFKPTLAAAAFLVFATNVMASDADPLHQSTGFDDGMSAGWLYQRNVPGIMWVDKHLGHTAPAIHHVQGGANGSMMFQRRTNWLQPLKAG